MTIIDDKWTSQQRCNSNGEYWHNDKDNYNEVDNNGDDNNVYDIMIMMMSIVMIMINNYDANDEWW